MEPVTVRSATVAEIEGAPNIGALMAEYAAESAHPGLGQPEAQWALYSQMEALGALHILGAYQGDALVGFLFVVVHVAPHYGRKAGTTESYFVTSSARKTGAGLKLLQAAEKLARDLGAVGLFVSSPVGSRLEQVLPSIGYLETNRLFFRGLQ